MESEVSQRGSHSISPKSIHFNYDTNYAYISGKLKCYSRLHFHLN